MTINKLNIRIRAVLYNEKGERIELFDSAIDCSQESLKKECAQISPQLKAKILKYLEQIKI